MAKEGSYPKLPISIVFKNSDRANAKYKLKTISNKTIDDLIDVNFIISGIPAKAVIKEVGIGKQFHNKYRKKFIPCPSSYATATDPNTEFLLYTS